MNKENIMVVTLSAEADGDEIVIVEKLVRFVDLSKEEQELIAAIPEDPGFLQKIGDTIRKWFGK